MTDPVKKSLTRKEKRVFFIIAVVFTVVMIRAGLFLKEMSDDYYCDTFQGNCSQHLSR